MASVLVIENDEELTNSITIALDNAGYTVISTSDADKGLSELFKSYPDIIVMDCQVPNVTKEDAVSKVRQATFLPMIVIGRKADAAACLDCGADAFIAKPLGVRELVARVRSLLKRKSKRDDRNSKIDRIHLRKENGDDDTPSLSDIEYRLASCLIRNKGRILDYSEIMDEVWLGKAITLDNLHFYVRRLRNKLKSIFSKSVDIINYRGIGYRLEGEIQLADDSHY